MEDKLRKAFKESSYRPEVTLSNDIWRKIESRQKHHDRFLLWSNGLAAVFFISILIPVIQSLLLQFSQSGFYEYVSLAFSDTSSIALYWKEFMLTLADSLPGTSLVLSFGLIFIILIFIKRTFVGFKHHALMA